MCLYQPNPVQNSIQNTNTRKLVTHRYIYTHGPAPAQPRRKTRPHIYSSTGTSPSPSLAGLPAPAVGVRGLQPRLCTLRLSAGAALCAVWASPGPVCRSGAAGLCLGAARGAARFLGGCFAASDWCAGPRGDSHVAFTWRDTGVWVLCLCIMTILLRMFPSSLLEHVDGAADQLRAVLVVQGLEDADQLEAHVPVVRGLLAVRGGRGTAHKDLEDV